VALAVREHPDDAAARDAAITRVATARPTAVNLARGAARVAAQVPHGLAAVLAAADLLRDEEIECSARQAVLGADLVTGLCGERPRLLTHCNTGALAAVVGGTALAVVAELHRRGRLAGVIASETRPLLQGARLTAWELGRLGVPFRLAVDGAGPFLMARGEVDAVIVGADRICANGDVVNKVGTYAHALGALRAGIPFLVVAPESTVDTGTAGGESVRIEDRGPAEVVAGNSAPAGADAVNPAFDVTPADLVTAIVTDRRVIRVDRGERP
jgi:methylthioribose-1-phosphate isomerase/methylthioribulose-1-phosphate dehydratase